MEMFFRGFWKERALVENQRNRVSSAATRILGAPENTNLLGPKAHVHNINLI